MAGDNDDREENKEHSWGHVVFSSLQGRLFQVVSPVEDMTVECFDFIQAISFWRSHWPFRTFELWIYGLGLCNIQHCFIRIGDDLLSRIIWQILHLKFPKLSFKQPLSLTKSALFCLSSIPNLLKATSGGVQGLNNIFDLFQPNRAVDLYFHWLETLWRVQKSNRFLLTFFQ